jgi:hypothetical protein
MSTFNTNNIISTYGLYRVEVKSGVITFVNILHRLFKLTTDCNWLMVDFEYFRHRTIQIGKAVYVINVDTGEITIDRFEKHAAPPGMRFP